MLPWLLLYFFVIIHAQLREKPVIISGVRVENPVGTKGFLGYTEAQEIIVEPDVPVTVNIFGYGLENVEFVSFTDSICLTAEYNITASNFLSIRETRITFTHVFIAWDRPWRMCIKTRGSDKQLQLDDDRTWVVTQESIQDTMMPRSLQWGTVALLLLFSAFCSGLSLGLMSLSTKELKIIIKSGKFTHFPNEIEVKGSPADARNASIILPVRENGNHLLATLLIVNVIVNSGATILLENLWSGLSSFICSTVGILIVGEIIPQSLCVKYCLEIGASTIWITRFLMVITSPLTWPIGKVLDFFIGETVDNFDRNRMVEILKLSIDQNSNNEMAAITRIAVGAIELSNKTACHVMTKIEDVFMISNEAILNSETLANIIQRGYSRIPIYEGDDKNNVKSVLFVNDLALLGRDSNIPVKGIAGYDNKKPWIVDENMPLPQLLEHFKTGRYHIAMVARMQGLGEDDRTKRMNFFIENSMRSIQRHEVLPLVEPKREISHTLVGLVTLEDILEEILQAEVIDESDSVIDNVTKNRRNLSSVTFIPKLLQDSIQNKMSQLFCNETKSENLSLRMFEMVQRSLDEQFGCFNLETFEHKALENLIQKNIRQVHIFCQKDCIQNPGLNLFTEGERSYRFILILEGKATVKFKKMTFTVGPWTTFGDKLIHNFLEGKHNSEDMEGWYFVSDYDVTVNGFCRFLQIQMTNLNVACTSTKFIREIKNPVLSLRGESVKEEPVIRKRSTTAAMATTSVEKFMKMSLENIREPGL